jgi:wyosine [tRNA(Phe)-imidazoG37] synthetase (radical SAM superfamily)
LRKHEREETVMAKYPIVVVKENPGTQEEPGKLVVAVQLGPENEVELKFPHVIGALGPTATLNGEPIDAENREFILELGEEEYSAD